MLLIKYLIKKDFSKKTRIRTMRRQPAPALALNRFSKSNTQGYPQEWWITLTAPPATGVTEKSFFRWHRLRGGFFSYFLTLLLLCLCL
ncbi:hypothetical protein CEQ31_001735 [Serratia odorifera]|nr:hypothetical protein CEQ31_001735 [Serratia odorifera]RII69703.1 hypothetical protein DX901_24530 [Serratia odorifera]